MKVVLADIEEANLAKAEAELKSLGGTVFGVRTDVSKRSDVDLLARQAIDAWSVIHGVKVFTPLMMGLNTECHIIRLR